MYMPRHYEESQLPELHQLIRDYPLATIITVDQAGQMQANHIPLHLDSEGGEWGTLRGHCARNNPMWQNLAPDNQTLVIFHGPNSYVSPQWSVAKKETGKAVPTWNYAVVHCHGSLRAFDGATAARKNVDELTARHEARLPPAWTLDEAPEDYTAKMLAAIVAIEMVITKIEGKWKVSQNQPAATQQSIANALRAQGGHDAMANMIEARIKTST